METKKNIDTLFHRVERMLDLHEVRLIEARYAAHEEKYPIDPREPAFVKGDLLVTLIGYDRGAMEWTQNWGQVEI